MVIFQRVGDADVNRRCHVWRRLEVAKWKCVLCGGISRAPTDNAECVRYEKLTEEDKDMCPYKNVR